MSTLRPIKTALTIAAATPISGYWWNQAPNSVPTAAEYAAQLAPPMTLSGTNRRHGNPVAPAVMLTATRPTGI